MSTEYTPTEDDIRHAWEYFAAGCGGSHPTDIDRFIARVKAEVLREAAAEVGALWFGGGITGSANRWGAKQAAERIRARADRIELEHNTQEENN